MLCSVAPRIPREAGTARFEPAQLAADRLTPCCGRDAGDKLSENSSRSPKAVAAARAVGQHAE
jgi:hypothetical protein